MSKTIFNFNFNFHLNIFLIFKNWRLKKSKTVATADLPQENSTRILETQIYNAEKREELQEPDKQWQRAAEARYHYEQALRRGRTFYNDSYLPPIPKMNNGRLKSLSESCHFDINELDKK